MPYVIPKGKLVTLRNDQPARYVHLTPNGDSVLLYTNKGELIRAQLTSESYQEISRVAVLEPTMPFAGRNVVWLPPAYANRHIFARNGKELICASLAAETVFRRGWSWSARRNSGLI